MASRPGVGRAVPRSPRRSRATSPGRAQSRSPPWGPAARSLLSRRPAVTFGREPRLGARSGCGEVVPVPAAVRESRARLLERWGWVRSAGWGTRLRPRSEGEESLVFTFIDPYDLTLVEFSFLRLTLQSTVCQQVKGKCTNPCKTESFFLEISNSTPAVMMLSVLLQQWFLNRRPGNDFLHRETSSSLVILLWCADRDSHKWDDKMRSWFWGMRMKYCFLESLTESTAQKG